MVLTAGAGRKSAIGLFHGMDKMMQRVWRAKKLPALAPDRDSGALWMKVDCIVMLHISWGQGLPLSTIHSGDPAGGAPWHGSAAVKFGQSTRREKPHMQ